MRGGEWDGWGEAIEGFGRQKLWSLRRFAGFANGVRSALHMVSARACRNRLVLGQEATEEESNEITAIAKLLELLEPTGGRVTLDAIGCQRAIAEQIIAQGGDYMHSLKGNQGTL